MLGLAARRPQFAPLSPWYGRAGFAAMVGFLAVGMATQPPARPALTVVGSVLAVCAGAALFLSNRLAPAAPAAAAIAGTALLASADASNLAWFSVCLVSGWCALIAGRAAGIAFLVAALVLFAVEWAFVHDPGWFAWTAGTAFTVLAALLVHHQTLMMEQMRDLQADLAQRERTEERARIARELHDVIAHSLTVSLLHVSSARLAIEHDPDDAARALADAERLTRRSLDEVRATVGMLRAPDDEGRSMPAAGIGDLQQLVDDLRAAQTDVRLEVQGDPDDVPATVSLTAYRIVQESLTNVSRHAPGALATVCVEIREATVDVVIDSNGTPGTGVGMGLANMRERADAVGGTFAAGPGGRGWLVSASLPRRGKSNGRLS
jgi:signal transduction histidine kinase